MRTQWTHERGRHPSCSKKFLASEGAEERPRQITGLETPPLRNLAGVGGRGCG